MKAEEFLILINLHAPGSGSAFPIRIRIQNSQMNADPDPDPGPQHWFYVLVRYNIYGEKLLHSILRPKYGGMVPQGYSCSVVRGARTIFKD